MIHIEKDVENIFDEVVRMRRYLHQIPELAFEEKKTSEYIIQKLEEYGIEVHKNIAKTGVIGYLRGTVGERTIAFRGDMDALNVSEKTGLDYASIHEGMMHACGHDAHVSMVLGLAKMLSQAKVKDHIIFLFQPAEEGTGGALPMIEEGVLEKFKVDKIMGLHVYPEIVQGKIGCKKGALMAQTGEFDIHIQGQSSHGAIPHKGKDALVIASEMISTYQSIISRNIDPIQGAVLTVGKMVGGKRRNVIAENAILEGTIRAFDQSIYDKIKERMTQIAKGMETMYDCKIQVVFRDLYPYVDNDEKMVEELENAIGRENVQTVEPQMIAEDFSYYQRKIPGLFFFLGVRNQEKNCIYPLHHSKFCIDEKVLLIGIQVYMNYLKSIKSL